MKRPCKPILKIYQALKINQIGSGCSTAVEHTPRNREVVGLGFFYFSILSVVPP